MDKIDKSNDPAPVLDDGASLRLPLPRLPGDAATAPAPLLERAISNAAVGAVRTLVVALLEAENAQLKQRLDLLEGLPVGAALVRLKEREWAVDRERPKKTFWDTKATALEALRADRSRAVGGGAVS